jgi:hypothetical protein
MTLASPSKRSLERWSHLAAGPPLVRFARPSTDTSRPRPLPGASSLRRDAATCRARSALVVSHHLDGLLRGRAGGFVAPRSRSGVRRVSGATEPVPSKQPKLTDGGGPPSPPPRDAGSHPSKSVLADSRNRIPAARCLLAVTGAVRRPRPRPQRTVPRRPNRGPVRARGPRGLRSGRNRGGGPLARAVVSMR